MSRTKTTLAMTACCVLAAIGAAAPALPGGGGSASEPASAQEFNDTKTTTTIVSDEREAFDAKVAAHEFYAARRKYQVAAYYDAAHKAELAKQAEIEAAAARAGEQEAAERAAQTTVTETAVSSSSTGGCSGIGDPGNDACWDRLAVCESGGNWAINTGNGYYGGLQFALSSWTGAGGSGYPHQASRAEQIRVARNLWASGGWGHWPACTSKFEWR